MVAAAWFFTDEANTYTDSVLEQLRRDTALVPPIWNLEMANILLVAEHRGRLAEAQSVRAIQYLQDLPIVVAGGGDIQSILALGRLHSLTAYDAAYLDLAMRAGHPLATQDNRLRAAAEQAGVPLLGSPDRS